VDLLNLLRAMQGSRVSRPMLEETELAILRFHQLYKELPPTELFPHVQQYQQAVTGLLAESQTIEVRRRLCSIAGHLVGLCQVGVRASFQRRVECVLWSWARCRANIRFAPLAAPGELFG